MSLRILHLQKQRRTFHLIHQVLETSTFVEAYINDTSQVKKSLHFHSQGIPKKREDMFLWDYVFSA